MQSAGIALAQPALPLGSRPSPRACRGAMSLPMCCKFKINRSQCAAHGGFPYSRQKICGETIAGFWIADIRAVWSAREVQHDEGVDEMAGRNRCYVCASCGHAVLGPWTFFRLQHAAPDTLVAWFSGFQPLCCRWRLRLRTRDRCAAPATFHGLGSNSRWVCSDTFFKPADGY